MSKPTVDATGRTLETIRAEHIHHGHSVGTAERPAMIGRMYYSPSGRRWTWAIRFVPRDRGVEDLGQGARFEPVASVEVVS